MRFFKENSAIITKLYINQIGIAIFSMFLYTIAGALQSENEDGFSLLMKVIVSILALLFYFVLIYLAVWEIGAKDKIRIDGGKAQKSIFKGLKLGIAANLVNFVVWGVSTLFMGIYLLNSAEWLKTSFAVINGIFRIFCSMYLGVVQGITSLLQFSNDNFYYLAESIEFFVLPLITVAVTQFAYFMGVNNYRIFPSGKKN